MSAPELLPWWPRDADECSRRLSIDTAAKVRAMVARLAELEARAAPSPAASEDADEYAAALKAWKNVERLVPERFGSTELYDAARMWGNAGFAAGRASVRRAK